MVDEAHAFCRTLVLLHVHPHASHLQITLNQVKREGDRVREAAAQRSRQHAYPNEGEIRMRSEPLSDVLVGSEAEGHVWNDRKEVDPHSFVQRANPRLTDAAVHPLQHLVRRPLLTNVHARLQNVDGIRTNHGSHSRTSSGNQTLKQRMGLEILLQTERDNLVYAIVNS